MKKHHKDCPAVDGFGCRCDELRTERTLPKSLHTVTVLVRLSRDVMRRHPGCCPRAALIVAQVVLGIEELSDTHGLCAAALKQLEGTPAPAA